MKKRILISCIALTCAVLGVVAQRGYTFNAVALNVDGLPAKVSGVAINEKGPLSEGTKTLSSLIAQKDWGFVGLSEDFNFHTELMSSISHLYNSGTHRGTVSGTTNRVDGLGLLCAKWYSFSDESWTRWSVSDGSISDLIAGKITDSDYDNGADELIYKGYRYYKVTIAEGFDIDVYVLHMDAASRQADINARESQLKQLASAVKTNTGNNKRPVIILGDTNCRYTREKLKELLIDEINKDARFTIKDAWIEQVWNGVYPTYGGESMMTHTYGAQRGEVVDKVFYINTTESNLTLKANSYLNDESVKVSDHTPIVVNFTLTDPKGTPESFEMETPDETVETWTDANPTNPTATITGKQFYMRNVSSGLYFKAGSTWGSHFAEGVDGLPVQMTQVSGNTYKISTPTLGRYLGNNYFADNGAEAEGNWLVEEIKSTSSKGGKMTKYIFRNAANNGMAIASSANGYHVDGATYNKADTKQQWVLYTYDEMVAAIKAEMTATLIGATCDASGLIYQPICNLGLDSRHDKWSMRPAIGGGGGGVNESCVWEVFRDNASHAFDFNQTVSGLPNGTYTVKVQAFFRDGNADTQSTNVEPVLYAGSQSTEIHSILDGALAKQPSWTWGHHNSKGWIPNDMWQANQWFKAGHYVVTLEDVAVTNGTLKIGIKNTSTATSMAWCCFDNFQLYYHGTAQGDLRTSALYKRIKAAADEAIATVESINSAEATAAFDISAVAYRYNNNLISADGAWEFAAIDKAVKTAVTAQTAKGANMSLLIENNSFEKGSTEGWTIAQKGLDSNAFKNEGEGNTTAYGDGAYYFNTWSGWEDYGCGMIYQDITGLRNGYYKLNALVASWGHKSVYLVGNKQSASIATTAEAATFVDFGLDFLVEDGTARIGAVGAGEDGNLYFKKGIFFKADNFRLTYMGSIGEGRVKCALADAKAKADKLHEGAKSQFNDAVAQYENATVAGDGKAEEAAIYNALKAAIATQPRTETDMTWLITNPGFETGDWTGWKVLDVWDERVAHATDEVAPGNAQGQYVVNVWNDWVDATNSGVNPPVYQTLTNLPNGKYRLTADVASDGGNQVTAYATVNGKNNYVAASPADKATFVTSTVEFDVTGNADVTIGAVGLRSGEFNAEGGCWYKCDNFRLTYLGHEGTLSEGDGVTSDDWYTSLVVARTIKAGKWNTFVVPFDMAIPNGWEVKKLTSSTMMGDAISLEFGKAETIEAGVAYMVRVGSNVSNLPTLENVQVSTTLINPSTNDIEFVGVYEAGNIPAGAFFISNNVFYQAADDTNTIKAFRAYLMPKGQAAKARSLSYRFDDEESTTGIDKEELTNDNEVTVVAIYTLGGIRIDEMQEGVNILQMSNGTTVKVIIK